MKRQKNRRASMLIVSLGILTLLSVLAVSFATLMMLENKASTNYLDGVRSNFLALSGRESAVIYLKKMVTDAKVLQNSTLSKRFPWIYNLGDYALPLEQALRDPALRKKTSYYGTLGATYTSGQDHFAIKIIDTNAQFNLNNRFVVTRGRGGRITDAIYIRILTNLGEAIRRIQKVPNPISPETAKKILDYRNQLENKEYSNKNQLRDILKKSQYLLIRDYVTAQSWIDYEAVIPSEEISGSDPYSTIGTLPSIGRQLSRRSPININTAGKELLTAVIMGIGGRIVHTYNDVDVQNTINKQVVDSQSAKWQVIKKAGNDTYESKGSNVNSLYIWLEPLIFNDARAIADVLVEYRKKRGAFDNFQELAMVLDDIAYGRIGSDIFGSYWKRVRNLTMSRLNSEVRDSSNRRNPFTSFGMDQVLSNLCRRGMADALKSNFNPNASVNFYNPNSGVAKVIDKANLLYMPPKANGKYPKVEVRQTVDLCFNPMGIFEITSLGQVISKNAVEAESKMRTVIWIYDAIRHTTQADFEANSDLFRTTQRADVTTYPEPSVNWKVDETSRLYKSLNGGGLPSGSTQLDADKGVVDGRVELKEADDSSARGKSNATFYAKWNTKENGKSWSEEHSDFSNYFAETRGGRDARWVYAYESRDFESDILLRKNASVQKSEGNLFPDGFYNTLFRSNSAVGLGGYRPKYLWYRAGFYDPTPTVPSTKNRSSQTIEQGEYSPDKFGGMEPNIDYYGGVIEFWYKPDKDWQHWVENSGQESPALSLFSYHNYGATDLFMGFLFISQLREKKQKDSNGQKTKSTGTQLFLYRTVYGDLRASRIYYEIMGEDPKSPNLTYPEQPMIIRNPVSDKAKKEADPKYVADNEARGLKEYIKIYEVDATDVGGTYPWPPEEIGAVAVGQLDSRIKRGRSDAVIYKRDLRYIKAHEWHHFSLSWNDSTTGNNRLAIKIDNRISSIPLPRMNERAFEGSFSRLNEIPGKNRDNFYIGSIFRKQLFVQSGIFKFTHGTNIIKEVCHGTIDDVYYFPLSKAGSVGIPQRFANSGLYTNAFALQDKFTGGIQQLQLSSINWTAYLPKTWHSLSKNVLGGFNGPKMKLRLWLSQYNPEKRTLSGVRPVQLPSGTDLTHLGNYLKNGTIPLIDPRTKQPYTARANEWLVYQIEFTAGSPMLNSVRNVVTPSLDDITLTYFLPQPKVLSESFILK